MSRRECNANESASRHGCKYYAFYVGRSFGYGRGDGCSHGFGCNIKLCPISAMTLEEAKEEVSEQIECGYRTEGIFIIEASQVVMFDLKGHLRNISEEKERAEYERLKRKFE